MFVRAVISAFINGVRTLFIARKQTDIKKIKAISGVSNYKLARLLAIIVLLAGTSLGISIIYIAFFYFK